MNPGIAMTLSIFFEEQISLAQATQTFFGCFFGLSEPIIWVMISDDLVPDILITAIAAAP
jgi:hypothetical protein